MGNLDGGLVIIFWLDPSWGIRQEFRLEIMKGILLGPSEAALVEK